MCTAMFAPCYLHPVEVSEKEQVVHTIQEFNQWYGMNTNKHLLSNKGIQECFVSLRHYIVFL